MFGSTMHTHTHLLAFLLYSSELYSVARITSVYAFDGCASILNLIIIFILFIYIYHIYSYIYVLVDGKLLLSCWSVCDPIFARFLLTRFSFFCLYSFFISLSSVLSSFPPVLGAYISPWQLDISST